MRLNQFLIQLSPGLFSYQIFVRAYAKPTIHNLLQETIEGTRQLKQSGPQAIPAPDQSALRSPSSAAIEQAL
jgi:hypothetical protein